MAIMCVCANQLKDNENNPSHRLIIFPFSPKRRREREISFKIEQITRSHAMLFPYCILSIREINAISENTCARDVCASWNAFAFV